MNKKKKRLSGVSMIEFALLLPILLLLLVGIVDISVLLLDKAIITNASREGARYGVVLRQPTYATMVSIAAYTKSYCDNKLISFTSPAPQVTVIATPSSPAPQFGDTLSVSVSYVYTDLMLHYFINHSQQYTLNATTVMMYE